MRIIPVIDLLGGQVVRGIGGRRSEYQPIQSKLASGSDPAAVAAAFVKHFSATTCYVADLDAIEGAQFDVAAWKSIAKAGMKLWLDAGIGTGHRLKRVDNWISENRIDAEFVIGSETLESEEELAALADQDQPQRLIFSLDLKAGRVLTRIGGWSSLLPQQIAARAIAAGITRVIVLDLADVGTGGGTRTLDLFCELRARHPNIELIAGGGVRGLDDLMRIAAAGCSAALVASSLHDGRLTRSDVATAGAKTPESACRHIPGRASPA